MLNRLMRPETRLGALIAAFGAGALATAWVAEHRLSMAPCALCLLERWPYRALLLLGLAAMVAPSRFARLILWLATAAFAAAIALALTHVGVEQHWWPDPLPQCMAPRFHGGTLAERMASMPRLPAKPCDTPNRLIKFLPLSMASLDLIFAVVISAVTVLVARGLVARRHITRKRGPT